MIKRPPKVWGNQPVYMVIGCPGAGKSWVCEQLTDHYEYVHHDLYVKMSGAVYVRAIIAAAKRSKRPLVTEAPFSISAIKDPLESFGLTVIPVFIIEDPGVIAGRYLARERKPIPQGHLTRQRTYEARAREWGAFTGGSTAVHQHLRDLALRGFAAA